MLHFAHCMSTFVRNKCTPLTIMRMSFSTKFLQRKALLLPILFALHACGPDKEVIVNEKVSEKVNAFRDKKNMECRQKLLVEAEQIVDSLLLAEAKMELGDSLTRLRPAKPLKPAPLPPIDSLKVQPIFTPAPSADGKK